VLIFASGATGNATPTEIVGGNTGLGHPNGIAVYNNEIYVSNNNSSSITVYNTTASGNASPLTTISGGTTTLQSPKGLFIH
jgi:hypothetical protein